MAPRARTKAKAEPETDESAAKDYTKYIDKEPTDLQERFVDWLVENVYGGDLGDMNEDDFAEGVRLGTALRMEFQRSPENQEILAKQREERENRADADEEDAETKPAAKRGRKPAAAKEEAPAAKPTRARRGRTAAKPEPEEDADETGGEEEPAAAKPARGRRAATGRTTKAPAAKAAATGATQRRGRRTAAKADAAPF